MSAIEEEAIGKFAVPTTVLLVAALGCFPFFVYFGLQYFSPAWVAVCLAALCAIRLCASGTRSAVGGKSVLIICSGGALLGLSGVLWQSHQPVLYYPAIVSATMLIAFTYSLFVPPSAIERIARLTGDDLTDSAVVYTRRVTIAWVIFFLLNGAVALYTAAYASLEAWTLYNGLIAYILIGAMLAGERLVRGLVMRRSST